MYVCIYIMLYNEFKKAGTANRVSFLNTETTEEEETAFSREQFLPLEPDHCNSHHNHLWVDGLQIFFPQPKEYFISMQAGLTEWG